MSIPSLTSVARVPPTPAAGATSGASGASGQGAFGSQLQSLLGGKSSSPSGAKATAFQPQPSRGSPHKAHQLSRGRHASSTDSDAASGTQSASDAASAPGGASGTSSASATGATSGTSGSSSSGQQGPGGVLLNDMMRGLQAYGATAATT